jgi:hypothetical protein
VTKNKENVWLHLTIRDFPNVILPKSKYGICTFAVWCRKELEYLRSSEKNGREFEITTDNNGKIGINHLIKREEIKEYHE